MTTRGQVLLIDDEEHVRMAGKQALELAGFEVACHGSAESALEHLSLDWPGVVVCDIKMPRMDGLAFMEQARQIDADLPVVLISGHADISMAVQAIRDGAYDLIEKPFPSDTLVEVVARAGEKRRLTLENRALRRELDVETAPGPRIVGKTHVMLKMRRRIAEIAEGDTDVLIHGETGTGKELVARYLHEQSKRAKGNFVAVNCGALPETMVESELFGHEAGSFTGASGQRIGKFEHANGGTILLDEIESMPPAIQVRLLRVLQERVVERLGSNEVIPLDLRVVAAAKGDLKEAVAQGGFREDLFYRLNVVTVEIPPLRERREDIPLLFHHFALVAGARYQREVPQLSSDQTTALMAYGWPGNVRELRNVAERFVLFRQGGEFDLDELVDGLGADQPMPLPLQVEAFEKSVIAQELARHKGDIGKTTDALGMPRKTLYDKMKKYGLSRRTYM